MNKKNLIKSYYNLTKFLRQTIFSKRHERLSIKEYKKQARTFTRKALKELKDSFTNTNENDQKERITQLKNKKR